MSGNADQKPPAQEPSPALEAWWLARGIGARRAIQSALLATAVLCGLSFFRFESKHEHTASTERTEFTIGRPDAWFRRAKSHEHADRNFTWKQDIGINVLTLSFGAGLLCYWSVGLLFRSMRVNKRQQASQGPVNRNGDVR